MAYKKSVYIKAKQLLDERKLNAELDQQQRHNEALEKIPELQQIEDELASHGAAVIKAVGMGGDVAEYVRELSMKNLATQSRRKALLTQHGFSEDYLDIRYKCPVCKDTGSHDGIYCSCYRKLIKELAREQLGDHSPLKKCTFDNFRVDLYPDVKDPQLNISQKVYMQKVFDFCKDYAESFSTDSQSLILIGKTGLGKTHLSLAIANKVIEKGYDVYYDSIQNIMSKLEREHFSRQPSEESLRDDIMSCDLLIIDDLGVEFTTQFTIAQLHSIINTRMLHSLPTIISTNIEAKEIEEIYSQRIASRILGYYKLLRFCGKDIRQIKK